MLCLHVQAADYLADEISISSLCSELGHRVFDASVFNQSKLASEPVSASMTTMMSEDAIVESHHIPTPQSPEVNSATVFGVAAGLRITNVMAMAEDETSSPVVGIPVVGEDQVCIP